MHDFYQSSLDDDSIFWDSAQVFPCNSQFESVEQVSSAGTMVDILGRFQGDDSMQIYVSEDWLDIFIQYPEQLVVNYILVVALS